jgi:hypothetical protein
MGRFLTILAALIVLSAVWALISLRGARVCGKNCGCRRKDECEDDQGKAGDR